MKVAHLSGEQEASVTFRDGLGVRMAALSEAGERLERFMLPDVFGPVQKAVEERVARLQNLHHVRFARLRGFERAPRGGQPVVISSETAGRRLSDVLLFGAHGLVTVDIGPALQVTREVLAALSVLHDSRNVTHGSIAPERIVLSPNGRVVIVEHVLSQALDRLQLPRHQLWRDWRIATPPAAGPVRFDTRTDLAQTGVTVLALLLGRSLEEEEYPHRLRGLLPVVRERLTAGGACRIARELQQWLERLLPSDGGRPYASVKEAQLAFEALVSTPASSLGMAPARVKALVTACAALENAPAESAARQKVDGEHTVVPPEVASEVFSVVPVAAPSDSAPAADVEDVDIAALLRLAAELDAESDGRVAPLATQVSAALEPADATIPPEPAAPAVGLDALASERVSLHQQFADLLAQVAPAAEETASPEPAASSLVLDAIRWTFEPVADGGSAALVPWRDATADEHAQIGTIGTTDNPVTTDVDAWLLTSLPSGDGGTDAASAHVHDAIEVSAPVVEPDFRLEVTPELPNDESEQPSAVAEVAELIADVLASDEPRLTLADVVAAESPLGADSVVEEVSASPDAIDTIEPAPVVLVEAADVEDVAETVVGAIVATVEPLPPLADVVATESPADADALVEEVTASADTIDAASVVLVEAADATVVAETVIADGLAFDEPSPAFELSAPADTFDTIDPALVVLVETADVEDVPETVIDEPIATIEPLPTLADVVAAESPVDADPLVEEVSAAGDACDATPIVLMEAADAAVVAETVIADVLATAEPPPAFVLSASADALDSSDPVPVVPIEAADVDEVAETVIDEPIASMGPHPTLADVVAAESPVDADSGVEELSASADAIDSSDPAAVVPVEAADVEDVAETAIADVLAFDESPVECADVSAAESVVDGDTRLEVTALAVSASAGALDSSDPAPVVPIEATDLEEVAETAVGEAIAFAEPPLALADVFAAEPIVIADTALDVAACTIDVVSPEPLSEADTRGEEVSVSADPIDQAPVVPVEAAHADVVAEVVIAAPIVAEDTRLEPAPLYVDGGDGRTTTDSLETAAAVTVHGAELDDVAAVADVVSPSPAAECELPPSAPVVEEAQAEVVLLPVATLSKRRRSRRKTRRSVEAEGVPPSPPLSAGLSLVDRDVPAWQPPADLRSVVADAARRAAVASAAPQVAPPVVPPVVFAPVEAETAPPIVPAPLPAAVTVVADLVATEPDHGREPEPRSRTIVVLRQQVNWRRTAAAAVIIALLETAAFGAAWWWVQPGAKGTLVVETSVPGVEVLIDGALVGHTPFHNEVRPGRHTLTLRRGGLERSMPVEINLGVVTTQTLPWPRPSTGALRVTSAPDGAEVLVGGRVRGRTPLTIDDLPAGRQTLLLRSPSGTVSAAASVVAGETAVVDVAIFAGWAQVHAAVELVVSIDGTRVGTSVDGQFLLSPGTHRIDVSNETLAFEQTLSATVEPGRVRSVTVTLPEVPLLAPDADGAEVFVDGVSRGVLPDGSITVPLGTHEVVLRGTDGVERRRTLTVRAGAPVSFD